MLARIEDKQEVYLVRNPRASTAGGEANVGKKHKDPVLVAPFLPLGSVSQAVEVLCYFLFPLFLCVSRGLCGLNALVFIFLYIFFILFYFYLFIYFILFVCVCERAYV